MTQSIKCSEGNSWILIIVPDPNASTSRARIDSKKRSVEISLGFAVTARPATGRRVAGVLRTRPSRRCFSLNFDSQHSATEPQRLVEPYPYHYYQNRSFASSLRRIVEAHGSKLLFLDFSRCNAPRDGPCNIIETCPHLRHLVLSECMHWPDTRSRALHVDVWLASPVNVPLKTKYMPPWDIGSAIRGDVVSSAHFAERIGCGTIRFLSSSLRTFPYLPTTLPPKSLSSGGPLRLSSLSEGIDTPHSSTRVTLHDVYGMLIMEVSTGIMAEGDLAPEFFLTDDRYIVSRPWQERTLGSRSESEPDSESESGLSSDGYTSSGIVEEEIYLSSPNADEGA
ncbi:hypothetical protein NM688_g9050 [Phlebia brevispora]|uniref:Uncharacterized protein n=1 Tax=Phlebia brevispora TaxID=194682 RepID=A0ACC1RLX1_9APHY|nr:hypothetical protein NM688_g9050 [Phlebia brevispora]